MPPVPALNRPKRLCVSAFLFYIADKAWLTTIVPKVVLGKKSTTKKHLSYILVKKTMFKRLGVSSSSKKTSFLSLSPVPFELIGPQK